MRIVEWLFQVCAFVLIRILWALNWLLLWRVQVGRHLPGYEVFSVEYQCRKGRARTLMVNRVFDYQLPAALWAEPFWFAIHFGKVGWVLITTPGEEFNRQRQLSIGGM